MYDTIRHNNLTRIQHISEKNEQFPFSQYIEHFPWILTSLWHSLEYKYHFKFNQPNFLAITYIFFLLKCKIHLSI